MFEEFIAASRERHGLAVKTAEKLVNLAHLPRDDESYADSVLFAATYSLLAIKRHTGIPLNAIEESEMELLTEEERMVLEDPLLRAHFVASSCTSMILDIGGSLDASHLTDNERAKIHERRDSLVALRLHAALYIADNDPQVAEDIIRSLQLNTFQTRPPATKVLI